jgi:hypothetical protein
MRQPDARVRNWLSMPQTDNRFDCEQAATIPREPAVPESRYAVKSRRFPAGANPARPIGRSAGSNQSDEGGNEFVEV